MNLTITLGELITIITLGFTVGVAYMRIIARIKKVDNSVIGNKYYIEFKLGEQDIRITYIDKVLKKIIERSKLDTQKEDAELKTKLSEAVDNYKHKMALLKAMGGTIVDAMEAKSEGTV